MKTKNRKGRYHGVQNRQNFLAKAFLALRVSLFVAVSVTAMTMTK